MHLHMGFVVSLPVAFFFLVSVTLSLHCTISFCFVFVIFYIFLIFLIFRVAFLVLLSSVCACVLLIFLWLVLFKKKKKIFEVPIQNFFNKKMLLFCFI